MISNFPGKNPIACKIFSILDQTVKPLLFVVTVVAGTLTEFSSYHNQAHMSL